MGDEEIGQVELLLQVLHQVDDLGLDRHVEGGDGLVGHDELGAHGERPRDADALPLAARELVGVAAQVIGAEADRLQEMDHALLALLARLGELVDDEGLADDRAHRHARVQRRVGVLEDDLHVSPEVAERPLVESRHVLTLEGDLARGRLDEAEDAAASGGLAAARLAHQPQRLALEDAERHVIDGVDARDLSGEEPTPDREVLLEVLDLEQRCLGHIVMT